MTPELLHELQTCGAITIQHIAHAEMLDAINTYKKRAQLYKLFCLPKFDVSIAYWYITGKDNLN